VSADPTKPGDAADPSALYAGAQVSPWTARQKAARALWIIARVPLFRMSWHNAYAWRRFVLRCFGARVGRRVVIRPSARIEVPWNLQIGDQSSIGDYARIYNLGMIRIGRRCTISQYAHLCAGTHDFTRWDTPLLRPPITIAADAFVGPGVTVGDGAILGARGVAVRDLEAWTIHAGNPARRLRARPPMSAPEGRP
jgi:putative colanic acid biosynthesis acetyltransferase WcaF